MKSNFFMARKKAQKKDKVWLGVLILLSVSLACSIPSQLISEQTQTPSSDASLGLIAYVGVDGNIYTTDRDGKQTGAITQDGERVQDLEPIRSIYQYPTWSPNGRRLAFVGLSNTESLGPQAVLYTGSSDGKNIVKTFISQNSFPFYLFWSPNSESVTFLANTADEMNLSLYMTATSEMDSKIVTTGQPFYWDWSPDSQTIITHTGGAASDNPRAQLAFIALDGSLDQKELDLNPGSFLAPDWSPQGDEIALDVENSSGMNELVLVDRDGTVKQVLAQLSGPTAFAWSPDGSRIAYTTSVDGDNSELVNQLILQDPTQPDSKKAVVSGIIVAFFWSPDSRKIAYFVLDTAQPGETSQIMAQNAPMINLVVNIYDIESGKTQQIASIAPTDAFLQIATYFDQYHRSGTIWSPDSKSLVLTGVDKDGNAGIYTVGWDGSNFQKIADGDMAFWSWK